MTATHRKGGRTAALVVLGLAAAGWGIPKLVGGDESGERIIEGAPVQRGSLRISVVERGNLKAADSVTLKSEIEGNATVLWLIEEGTEVQPGDLLCELDATSLVNRRVQQEIKVQNAEASFVKAKQNHAIQLSQNESDIARGRQELEFAEIDLLKYLEGDMPQELQSKDEDILLADEELSRASQDLIWSEELESRGFLEQTQLDADRLAKTRAEIKLNQARRAKELYENYEIPRRQKELESDVAEAKRELERISLQATARIADYTADVRTTDATFQLERDELAKIVAQIEKAVLKAPVAGMVVYAVDGRSRWGDGDPMQEGTSVRERQDIITIPSSEGFVAEASLHESVLEKVELGMACLVTVDALQKTFPGRVHFKAVLPDQSSFWANPDLRVYRTEVRIETKEPRLRPGMSCSIEILVDELQDVTYVPVQAVFLDAGKPVCLVAQPGRNPEKRAVEVGQNNGKWVEIRSGVAAGETVLLALPSGMTLQPAQEQPREPDDGWGEADKPSDTGVGGTEREGGAGEGGASESGGRPPASDRMQRDGEHGGGDRSKAGRKPGGGEGRPATPAKGDAP